MALMKISQMHAGGCPQAPGSSSLRKVTPWEATEGPLPLLSLQGPLLGKTLRPPKDGGVGGKGGWEGGGRKRWRRKEEEEGKGKRRLKRRRRPPFLGPTAFAKPSPGPLSSVSGADRSRQVLKSTLEGFQRYPQGRK